jgi:predicted small metal-binding protein
MDRGILLVARGFPEVPFGKLRGGSICTEPRIEKRRRCFMSKVIRCRDAGMDCDFVVRGETEEELFRNALEHGRTFHGMKEIPIDLQEKMRKLIREEKAA